MALIFQEFDDESISEFLPSADLAGATAAAAGATDSLPDGVSAEDAASAVEEASAEDDVLIGGVVQPNVGMYGTSTELQIDISRIPRIDEYANFGNEAVMMDRVSDIKTVHYYLTFGNLAEADESIIPLTGLVRREMDRAVTMFQQEQGMFTEETPSDILAPEINAIEFLYTDGLDWYPEWDSDLYKGLPKAILVAISFAANDNLTEPQSLLDATTEAPIGDVYRFLLQIPAAQDNAGSLEAALEEDEL